MNKKTQNLLIGQSNDKISRLIALPLLKTEFKDGNIPDYSIDSIINIQKMINTRPQIDLARFKKGKEYFIEYSNNVSDYLKNKNLNKELKLLDLKNYKDHNSTNNNNIPVLKILNTTVDNIIFEAATPDSDLIKIKNKKNFNYSIPS